VSLLSLDIGTSSCRVMLWNDRGQADGKNPLSQIAYVMDTTQDGGVFMDAERLFAHVVQCLDEATKAAGERLNSVQAVGITTFWHSVLGVDASGIPTTPLLNWSDTRAADACNDLRQTLDGDAVHARTGCVLHPSYYPAKLAWLRANHSDVWERTARWISISEFVLMRLFGQTLDEVRASVSVASGTGLYHHATQTWDAELLDALGVPETKLSPLCDLHDTLTGLAAGFASRWKPLASVPFVPAVGDGACSNIGSGCMDASRFAINLGTSGAIRAVSQTVTADIPFGLWQYRIDAARPLVGTAFSDGGHVMAWLNKTLRLPPQDELNALLEVMEPGAHRLTFLPFLAGERGLNWNPNTRAAILGLNLDSEPVEIARAAMEAVALQFAAAAGRLRELFPHVEEIVASGGAFAHYPFWAQIICDALGQPVMLSSEPEATSRGAARLADEIVSAGKSDFDDPAPAQILLPNPAHHARYQELGAAMQRTYRQIQN
jgi:gluconokinase